MPKLTIRFYSASDTYHDWKYLSEVTYFEILNWINSGNYIKHKDPIIDSIIDSNSSKNQIFALLRKGKK